MRIVADDAHRDHWVTEISDGRSQPSWEQPIRAEHIDAELGRRSFGPVLAPEPVADELLHRVHSERYVAFLDRAWDRWCEAGRAGSGDAMGFTWPTPGLHRLRADRSIDIESAPIDALLGWFSFAADCSIGPHTARAVRASASAAATAAELVAADPTRPAFARCRPPGHHAMTESFGGYCYVNNAAVAAQLLLDRGAEQVAVLDVDYHHGNGTQEIFYHRPDVVVVSLHADPAVEFPWFSGYADEVGAGMGEGATLNLPLPWGTDFARWSGAFEEAARVAASADAVVVSLGVDTYGGDPISRFTFTSDDYLTLGTMLARLGKPTVFVMEGGYATESIGINVANVLAGFVGS